MMDLIFYASGSRGRTEQLRKMIKDAIPGKKIRPLHSIEMLSHRLRRPRLGSSVAVLFAGTREDLLQLLLVRWLLVDSRVLLVLPDRDKETVGMGHCLCPRFLTYIDSDFKELTCVLRNMVSDAPLERRVKGDPIHR